MYRILIADDNTTLTIQLEEYLPTIGYEVKGVASSGLGAVEMARTLKPDLILMDIKMPGKLNGIEAASIIKSELGIDILFISGYADEELLEMAKLVEPLGYIHKPFSDEQIAAALKRWHVTKSVEMGYGQTHWMSYPPPTKISLLQKHVLFN
jgi:CheY-like chemotaxis protein